mgnify:CR=1 FL=1
MQCSEKAPLSLTVAASELAAVVHAVFGSFCSCLILCHTSLPWLSLAAGADLLRIVGILSVGMVATLMFTAQITVFIREAVKTPVKEIAKAKPSPPFMSLHYIAWGSIFAASFAAIAVGGPQLAQQAALPYGLAITLGGFLLGESSVLLQPGLLLFRVRIGDVWSLACLFNFLE